INLILTPDAKYVISTDAGYYQSLWVTRTSDGKGVSRVDFSNETPAATTRPTSQSAGPHPGGEGGAPPPTEGSSATNGLYYGLAVSHDGQIVYAAQGGHDSIAVLSLNRDGKLALRDRIVTRHQDFP